MSIKQGVMGHVPPIDNDWNFNELSEEEKAVKDGQLNAKIKKVTSRNYILNSCK